MFSVVGDVSVCASVVETDPDEPMDPRRESIRTLDEDSGRAAKDPDVWSGLRGISILTAEVESERVAWKATEPEVCKGLRGTMLLAEGVESERAACEGTEPDVCKGLRGTILLAEGVESERVCEGVDPEVRRGLRVESRASFDCSSNYSSCCRAVGGAPHFYCVPCNSRIVCANSSTPRKNRSQRGSSRKGSSAGFTAAVANTPNPTSRARSSSANPRSKSPSAP
jgi:hypothetical protein